MKITQLGVQNFLGISAVTIEPKYPIVLVGAPNGAGKTSIYQAMRLALFDELPRVDLKRDTAALVRGGAAKGAITAMLENGDTKQPFNVTLPDRKRTTPPLNGVSSFCLEPALFGGLDPGARRGMVLALSGVSMSKDAIAKRLLAHGISPGVVAELDPLLVLGFEKCAEHAKEQATEHRGAWKAITGEVYGSQKAETWTPGKASELPNPPDDMDKAIAAHAVAVRALGDLDNRIAIYDDRAAKRASDEVLAPTVAGLEQRVGELTRTAGANVEPHYLICPSCQAKLVQQMDGELALPEPAADQAIKPSVRAKARTELAKAQVQLTAARNAAARLAEPPPALPRPTEEQMTKAKDEVAQAADFLAGLRRQQEAYAAAAQARIEHDRRLENAKTEHLWVGGWTKAQEALSPNGIPSELMAQAMGPMRAAIKEACASEYVRDWPLPELADDGGISAWGRPYPLLSESEQYRVDAILTVALARLSGVRMIAMDRADVLTPQVRSELIGWLGDMSDDGALEQAWCFSSMKGRPDPAALAELDVDGYWIEGGTLHG